MRVCSRFLCFLFLIITFPHCLQSQSSVTKPNIVFIMADDHALKAISAYPGSLIHTENIDRIASNGAIMDSGFVTNSVCSPSRAVILTGKYSHMNGLRDNGTYFNGAQNHLAKILQQNGYRTAMIGKWHLWSDPTGFNYWNILPAQGHYYDPPFILNGRDTAYKGYITDVTTDLAIDWIEKNKQQPFSIFVYHKAPHRNCMPPIKYLDEFDDRDFAMPDNFFDDYDNRKALQRQQLMMAEDLDIRYDSKIPCDTCAINPINDWAPAEYQRELERLTPAERRKWDAHYAKEYAQFKKLSSDKERIHFQFQRYLEDYLRCIHSLDDNVGRLLDYLKQSGLEKNTIVIYTSDQGFFLGEHGLYDKRFMYEEAFRTPMMIQYPGHIPKGEHISEYALNLDWAPTILDFADIPIPDSMQGESMKNLLTRGSDSKWRKEIYYHYYERSFGATPHYGIRTPQYKLIHFYKDVDSWELYDLSKDPEEMHNLYGDRQYDDIVSNLKTKLAELQEKYQDEAFLKNITQ